VATRRTRVGISELALFSPVCDLDALESERVRAHENAGRPFLAEWPDVEAALFAGLGHEQVFDPPTFTRCAFLIIVAQTVQTRASAGRGDAAVAVFTLLSGLDALFGVVGAIEPLLTIVVAVAVFTRAQLGAASARAAIRELTDADAFALDVSRAVPAAFDRADGRFFTALGIWIVDFVAAACADFVEALFHLVGVVRGTVVFDGSDDVVETLSVQGIDEVALAVVFRNVRVEERIQRAITSQNTAA